MDLFLLGFLIANVVSFFGIMFLHWLTFNKFPNKQFELFLVCIAIGVFFFLLLLFVYVPVIRNKKGKYEGP